MNNQPYRSPEPSPPPVIIDSGSSNHIIPALPPASNISEETIQPNRFLQDDITLQSQFNKYINTNNIQCNDIINQEPLPMTKEKQPNPQQDLVDCLKENGPPVDNVTPAAQQEHFQVRLAYENMVIDLELVTKAQTQVPSAYAPLHMNEPICSAPTNQLPIPPAIEAQLNLLVAYFEDWKLARATNNPLKWALAVKGAQGVQDDLCRKMKGRMFHEELRKRLWIDNEVWNPWHYQVHTMERKTCRFQFPNMELGPSRKRSLTQKELDEAADAALDLVNRARFATTLAKKKKGIQGPSKMC
ncbi:hypothetical protein CROQUDRAFT_101010 [Cronartium quercuum f. sp. fusiforme G11]|uniref:Transposase n=1 Tax=Cronartium quercuum f. sp. fusiforme G11 TaxID=708437 RepID=A0A9P6T5L3_9BASI|nr:hypothetical protein CROQUDRAFT_101010 [Cronartium quercuum f. sp. fusiforme G11]